MKNNKNIIIVHFDEIAIKGKNRRDFELTLASNLNKMLKNLNLQANARNIWGRILIEGEFIDKEKELADRLSLFPGVSNFGFALRVKKDINELFNSAQYFVEKIADSSFRVSCKRVDKSFPKISQEIEREFGAKLFEIEPELKVDLKNFRKEIRIEILHNEIFIYINHKGIGGLPVGSSGKAVALLSAGFDSPVAAFLMMKRGVEVYPIHFHASEKVGPEALRAVEDLVQVLRKIQPDMSLAVVDVLGIQKYIAKEAPDKLRIVLLRRAFNKMSSSYARQVGALALVTGESVGQVASQTLENILVTNDASDLPVLRPLSGMNKEEIIGLSRKIATHDISARPCDDTCSLFLPKFPETKARLDKVLEVENSLKDLEKLLDETMQKMQIVN